MRTSHRLALASAALLLVTACSSGDDETGSAADTAVAPSTIDAAGESAADSATATDSATAGDGGLAALGLTTTTPAGTQPVDSITWALYRDVNNLDPVFAFDYPENTALALLCEQPLRQAPDGTIVPGIADVANPDDLTYVITLRDGVTFWNGDPVTADDVAFSLGRNMDPAIPSFYGAQYSNVDVDRRHRRTHGHRHDELSPTCGSAARSPRRRRGSSRSRSSRPPAPTSATRPAARCAPARTSSVTGASARRSRSMRNDTYWDTSVKPLVGAIEFVGAPDPIALSAALQSGDVDGYFAFASIPTLNELKQDSNVTVTDGAGYQFDALLLAPREGSPLADVRVRQALSKAIDRQGYIDTVLAGAGQSAKSFAAPGTWGYARDVFEAGYDALLRPGAGPRRRPGSSSPTPAPRAGRSRSV